MSKQMNVRLSDDTFARLKALAARTGRSTSDYLREAIEAHLEELEDVYQAERVLERLRRGEARRSFTLDEVEHKPCPAD